MAEAVWLEEMPVGERQPAVVFDLLCDRIGGFDKAFVPVGVLFHKGTNFLDFEFLIVVAVSLVDQTLPELVFVDGAGVCHSKQEEKANETHVLLCPTRA